MAITIDDFSKIWASTSPLTPYAFSENNYKEGWNFVGATPPSRQMWDFLQKQNDEKLKYLLDNFDNYLPLSGGTMTGSIEMSGKTIHFVDSSETTGSGGWIGAVGNGIRISAENFGISQAGGRIDLVGRNYQTDAGSFSITASDTNNTSSLNGKPDGTLTWDGQNVVTAPNGEFIKFISFSLNGSVSANNWGDYSAEIPFPQGYSHVVGVTRISVPSPSAMKLVGFWQNGTDFVVRVYSTATISGTIDVTLSVCK